MAETRRRWSTPPTIVRIAARPAHRWSGVEPEVGIEPTTYRLQGGCSTTELHRPDTARHPSSAIHSPTYPGRHAAVDRRRPGRGRMTPGERFTRRVRSALRREAHGLLHPGPPTVQLMRPLGPSVPDDARVQQVPDRCLRVGE